MKKEIVLTPKQLECVNYPENSNLIVKGIAGSGKSLVIVRRALKFNRDGRNSGTIPRIAIFTYANSLVNYTREIVSASGYLADNITISTMDKEIIKLYSAVMHRNPYGKYFEFEDDILDAIVDDLRETENNRFLEADRHDFLKDELYWMKEHFIKDRNTYIKCVRTGRGFVRPSDKERDLIYTIYEKYYNELRLRRGNKIEVMYEELYNKIETISDDLKYDFVLIDECQDLSYSRLKIARALAKKSITFATDTAQKIYRTGFSWKELGIKVTSHSSKTLKGTFRNTYEIMSFATDFIKHNKDQSEFVEPEMPDRHDSKPSLYIINQPFAVQEQIMIDTIKKLLKNGPDNTVGIILQTNPQTNGFNKTLARNNLAAQIISTRSDYKITEPGIKLVTMHSSKGLEFDYVIIPYLNEGKIPRFFTGSSDDDREDIITTARNLLYVAMTRARYGLYMFSGSKPSSLIDDFNRDLVDIIKM